MRKGLKSDVPGSLVHGTFVHQPTHFELKNAIFLELAYVANMVTSQILKEAERKNGFGRLITKRRR